MDSWVNYVRHLKLYIINSDSMWTIIVIYCYRDELGGIRAPLSGQAPVTDLPVSDLAHDWLSLFHPVSLGLMFQAHLDSWQVSHAPGKPTCFWFLQEQALSPRAGFVYSQACLCQLYLLLWDHGIKSQINQWNVSCLFLWEHIWILWENSIKTSWWKNCRQFK